MKIIDATDQVMGRMASQVAKALLQGEEVYVVNAEKAVISGDVSYTLDLYKQRRTRGDPYHGPFFPRDPERIVKRAVRGMLPYKKPHGSAAFKRLKVFRSVPAHITGDIRPIGKADNRNEKFLTVGHLARRLGSK